MNKSQMLELIKLLSALESWSFSTAKPMPDYLFDRMDSAISELSDHILRVDLDVKNVRD